MKIFKIYRFTFKLMLLKVDFVVYWSWKPLIFLWAYVCRTVYSRIRVVGCSHLFKWIAGCMRLVGGCETEFFSTRISRTLEIRLIELIDPALMFSRILKKILKDFLIQSSNIPSEDTFTNFHFNLVFTYNIIWVEQKTRLE